MIRTTPGRPGLFLVSATLAVVTAATVATPAHAATVTPDAHQIVFASKTDSTRGIARHGISSYNVDTGVTTSYYASSNASGAWDTDDPRLSPDGTKVAFTYGQDLQVQDIATGRVTSLGVMGAEHPVWTPDGTQIVFAKYGPWDTAHGTSEHDLYRIPATGGAAVPLTNGSFARFPEISPDGRQVSFTDESHDASGKALPYAVGVMNVDGTNRHRITTTSGCAAWSPDGTKFATLVPGTGSTDATLVAVMATDGSGLVTLPTKPDGQPAGSARCPTWSSDGQTLYFAQMRDSSNMATWDLDIWSIHADGTQLTDVISTPNDDTMPSFRGPEPLPASVPAPPAITAAAKASANAVDLNWTAPDTGTVTGYVVHAEPGNFETVVTDAATTSARLTGLTADAMYDITVNAVNAVGGGLPSAPVAVSMYGPPTIDIVDNPWQLAGQPVTVRGHARPGAEMTLFATDALNPTTPRSLGGGVTGADGVWAVTTTFSYNTALHVVSSDGSSAVTTVGVRVKVTIDSVRYQYKDARGRCVVRFNGGTYPYIPGASVYIRTSTGTPIGFTKVTQYGASGRYSALFGLTCGTTYKLFPLITGRAADDNIYTLNGTGTTVSVSTPR